MSKGKMNEENSFLNMNDTPECYHLDTEQRADGIYCKSCGKKLEAINVSNIITVDDQLPVCVICKKEKDNIIPHLMICEDCIEELRKLIKK